MIFLDTSTIYALADRDDEYHQEAVLLYQDALKKKKDSSSIIISSLNRQHCCNAASGSQSPSNSCTMPNPSPSSGLMKIFMILRANAWQHPTQRKSVSLTL